jgi:hypothetical protein
MRRETQVPTAVDSDDCISEFIIVTYQNFHHGLCFGMPEVILTARESVGNLTVGASVRFGGRWIRTSRFGRGGSPSPLKPAAMVGPRGGRGGKPLCCGFGAGWSTSFMRRGNAP